MVNKFTVILVGMEEEENFPVEWLIPFHVLTRFRVFIAKGKYGKFCLQGAEGTEEGTTAYKLSALTTGSHWPACY